MDEGQRNADTTGKWERPHRKVGIPPTVARRRAAGQALMWNDAWGGKVPPNDRKRSSLFREM